MTLTSEVSVACLIQIKQAREPGLVPNARARVGFADGSMKTVLEKLPDKHLITKSEHKI
jgi:hypothetical protein